MECFLGAYCLCTLCLVFVPWSGWAKNCVLFRKKMTHPYALATTWPPPSLYTPGSILDIRQCMQHLHTGCPILNTTPRSWLFPYCHIRLKVVSALRGEQQGRLTGAAGHPSVLLSCDYCGPLHGVSSVESGKMLSIEL